LTVASTYFQRGAPPLSSVVPPTPVSVPVSTVPKIEIRSSTLVVKAAEPILPVALSCSQAACSGSVELVEGATSRSGARAIAGSRHDATTITKAAVVLASASFQLQNREIANVNLVVTSDGREVFRSASLGSPKSDTLVATVDGGVGATKTVVVG
jgi:hypothetical protein